jgi:hypothetical protein
MSDARVGKRRSVGFRSDETQLQSSARTLITLRGQPTVTDRGCTACLDDDWIPVMKAAIQIGAFCEHRPGVVRAGSQHL